MMNYGLKDKIIFVTGGGSGIGRAIALMAARDGANVVVADAVAQRASAVAAELRDLGVTAIEETLDVRDGLACEAVVERIEKQLGPIDGMVACAGISTPSAATEMSDEIWSRCLDVNLTGMFLCAQAAFRIMKSQTPRGGRIINNGSISAHAPRPDSAPYTCTKHAVTGLTKCISLDGRKYDIACGQIDVGNAMTELAARMSKGVKQANGEVAIEAMMDVKEVANAVVHMADLPLATNIQFITIMASKMPFVGRG